MEEIARPAPEAEAYDRKQSNHGQRSELNTVVHPVCGGGSVRLRRLSDLPLVRRAHDQGQGEDGEETHDIQGRRTPSGSERPIGGTGCG